MAFADRTACHKIKCRWQLQTHNGISELKNCVEDPEASGALKWKDINLYLRRLIRGDCIFSYPISKLILIIPTNWVSNTSSDGIGPFLYYIYNEIKNVFHNIVTSINTQKVYGTSISVILRTTFVHIVICFCRVTLLIKSK